jgi:kelch-like protein 2/3
MFTCNMSESHQASIPLIGVDPSIAEKLIDFAYTSEVTITQDNVQSLLSAANLLEMLNVRDACCQVIAKILP